MVIREIEPFIKELNDAGYKKERYLTSQAQGKTEYWKGFHMDQEDRQYTVWFEIFDRSVIGSDYDFETHGRYGIQMFMSVNHESNIDCDHMKISVMHESMTIQEWERRCLDLYTAMLISFPKK